MAVVANSLYGQFYYGSLLYNGSITPPFGYIVGDITFSEESKKDYITGNVLLENRALSYVAGNILLEKHDKKYILGNVDLVYTKIRYLEGEALLEAHKKKFLLGNISFVYGLLPYEVEDFQCVVSRNDIKFFWKDSN